jgi:hypothetical protein
MLETFVLDVTVLDCQPKYHSQGAEIRKTNILNEHVENVW